MIRYMVRRSTLAIFALAALALAGCTSTASSPQPNAHEGPPTYAVFTGALHLRGEIRVDGQFTDAVTGRGETCDQYAYGRVAATTLWVSPTPNNAELVNGHTVIFTAGVAGTDRNFQGPGLYIQPTAHVDVLLVDNASFLAGDTPATVITVTSTGGGSMAFSGMVDTTSGADESGTETWTCTSSVAPLASGSQAPPRIVSPVGAPLLQGMITIDGPYQSSVHFQTRAEVEAAGSSGDIASQLTCGDYARGEPNSSDNTRSFVAPEVDTGGANAVYFSIALPAGYAGPGVYSSEAFPALTGTIAVTIPPTSAPQFDSFTSRNGGSTTLTVKADGSGVVQVSNWYSGASDSRLFGRISWTCSAGS